MSGPGGPPSGGRVVHDTSGTHSQGDVTDKPCPAITVGVGSLNTAHFRVERAPAPPSPLPPCPLDFTQDPPNGLTVISTFSGAGGSSLGYKLAGFSVRAAVEFDREAQDTYRANFSDTPLITADIRTVAGADLLRAAGIGVGELDVLDGSPPCASFSTAGKRERTWGQVRDYSGQRQRVDDLFDEFVRLIGELQPKVFVAENVSGLVKGVAKGCFKAILRSMKGCGYRVEARLLDAKHLAVPQSRQRLIFVGVRHDLGRDPAFPRPRLPVLTIRDVLPWITDVADDRRPCRMGAAAGTATDVGAEAAGDWTVSEETDIGRFSIGREWDRLRPGEASGRYFNLVRPDPDRPCPTVTQTGGQLGAAAVVHPTERRKFTIAELKRLCAFPDDFVLTGSYAEQWERLGRAVPPLMMRVIARAIRDEVLLPARAAAGRGTDG